MYLVHNAEDVGLPTKFRINAGQASQPIASSMPANRLRHWRNTNPSLGLLYTLRKHVAFTRCCCNVDPQSSTLARNWNSIGWLYRVFWLLHVGDYAGDARKSNQSSKHLSQKVVMKVRFFTLLEKNCYCRDDWNDDVSCMPSIQHPSWVDMSYKNVG